MPNYNNEKYLPEAIESILKQSFKDFEFIIVDDCSTDNSWDIIEEYAKKDSRVRAYRNYVNSGVSKTLNNGLDKCSGELIARMDSDDISFKTRFEEQLKLIDVGFDVVGSGIELINSNGKKIGLRKYSNEIDKVIRIESPLAHPSVMFKRELIEKYGKYENNFPVSQDYDLWLRFYSNGAKIINSSKVLLKYRIHKTQVKTLKTKKVIKTVLLIKNRAKKKYGIKFGFEGNIRILLERTLLLLPSKFILFLFYLIRK